MLSSSKGILILGWEPPGLEDDSSLCVGVKAFGRNRETHSKQIRKRGLYEEAMGILHKTGLIDSAQEEPRLGKSPSISLTSLLSQSIQQVSSFCKHLLGTYFLSYAELDTEIQ